MEFKYTTIFIGNAMNPTRLLMLKRAKTKAFAPNYYTGLGGKTEPGETQDECAIRELYEESRIRTELVQFGQAVVNKQKLISYYFGVVSKELLPECNEGTLEWFNTNTLINNCSPIIKTAKHILTEWQSRNWETSKPFTLTVTRSGGIDDFDKTPEMVILEEGLLYE